MSFTLPSIFLSSRKAQKTFRKARLVLHQHLILLLVLQTSTARHMDSKGRGTGVDLRRRQVYSEGLLRH